MIENLRTDSKPLISEIVWSEMSDYWKIFKMKWKTSETKSKIENCQNLKQRLKSCRRKFLRFRFRSYKNNADFKEMFKPITERLREKQHKLSEKLSGLNKIMEKRKEEINELTFDLTTKNLGRAKITKIFLILIFLLLNSYACRVRHARGWSL